MSKRSKTYDVFISCLRRDSSTAQKIAVHVRGAGLVPFLAVPGEILSEERDSDYVLWEALAESEALIVAMSSEAPSMAMGIDIGAASAWHKPIYVVFDGASLPDVSPMVQRYPLYPIGRIDEVVAAICSGLKPLSDLELAVLASLYREYAVPTDQIRSKPDILARLARSFNRRTGRDCSGEHLLREMIRMRKSGKWLVLQKTANLTDRQREILYLTVDGKSTSEIAATLELSERTVEAHRAHLRARLGANTDSQLSEYVPSQRVPTSGVLPGKESGTALLRRVSLSGVGEEDTVLSSAGVFVRTEAYNKMLADDGVLAVGRKGAGKTAVRYALSWFGDIRYDVWVDLALQEFDYTRFYHLVQSILPDPQVGLAQLLENTWRVTIVSAIMSKVRHSRLVASRDTKLPTLIESCLQKYGLDDTSPFYSSAPDQVLERIRSKYSYPQTIGGQNTYPMDKDFISTEMRMFDALNCGHGAVVTLDDIDKCWLQPYNEIVVPTTEALIRASMDLMHLYGPSSVRSGGRNSLRIKCFVPEDIYSSLNYRHKDKLAAHSTRIQWKVEQLRELLARRIAPHLAGQLRDVPAEHSTEIVQQIFGRRVAGYWSGGADPFRCLLDHTLFRPRDVLILTDMILKRACDKRGNASHVEAEDFLPFLVASTREYSEHVIREYQAKWQHLSEDIALIRNEAALVPGSRLKAKFCQIHHLSSAEGDFLGHTRWNEAMGSLYDAGVLGYREPIKEKEGALREKWIFSFVHPDGRIPSNCDLAIHPLFWSACNIAPARFDIDKP